VWACRKAESVRAGKKIVVRPVANVVHFL
jgi:hypothetical protein